MCIKFFKKKPDKPIVITGTVEYPVTLPHPPENPNTIEDDSQFMFETWLKDWKVPLEYHDFWRSISIHLAENYPWPATYTDVDGNPLTFDDDYITINPIWDTPGVCAHEMAHVSWNLLTPKDKEEFGLLHDRYKITDPLVQSLYSFNTYGLTNQNEGHSEIYRYLGDKMPELLKQFYPRLL